jgi:hypothetical protein
MALVMPETATGTELSTVVPLPSAPPLLPPQHCIVPPATSAQVPVPAATVMALVMPETVTGKVLPLVVPLPSAR